MKLTMGDALRQLRRQKSMTQTDLGGAQYSKSYVSAVEHDKIVPSYQALRHFSSQLGQATDYFEQFLPQREQAITPFQAPSLSLHEHEAMLDNALTFLDILVEGEAFPSQYPLQEMGFLPSDVLASLSREKQTAHLFWTGYRARQQGDIDEALSAYESAFGVAVEKYLPVILDEIGTCHALASAYHRALHAHCRALELLQAGTRKLPSSSMRLRVELHCAQDYQELEQHTTALVHYEVTRGLLQGHSDVKTAAQIYSGIGYCTYASQFGEEQRMSSSISNTKARNVFQEAIDCLKQASTLYAIARERKEETRTRLMQVSVLLDDCTYSRGNAQPNSTELDDAEVKRRATLLIMAEEQCRQILANEQEEQELTTPLHDEALALLLLFVVSLLSIYVQRLVLARNDGNSSAVKQAQAWAIWFCQQTLPLLATDVSLSWKQLQKIVDTPMYVGESVQTVIPSLPPLHAPALQECQAELSLTIGRLAELLAETAPTDASRNDFFLQADDLFQNALSLWKAARQRHRSGGMLLRRGYQYVIRILEERIEAYPSQSERHVQTLLKLLSIT